jgi:SAM-dependent methyltransferase
MGRFASTVEFYSRYREPYSPRFFLTVAERLELRGTEKLLDAGCGPGPLAIGFAPFVKDVTALDPEATMIAAARSAAAEAGVNISFVHQKLERFSAASTFDVITIGRALHWLDREAALRVLRQIVGASGHILICGASNTDTPEFPWVKPYDVARRAFAPEPDEARYRIDGRKWFSGSEFEQADTIPVAERRAVTVTELVGRALSKSNTSPAVLGARREEFEAQIKAVLEPFARDGVVREEIVSRATVFKRRAASAAS